MIEHKGATSHKDVGAFYNAKYKEAGFEAFSNKDRRVYLDLLEKFGGSFLTGKSVLDAGCGHGEFLECFPVFMRRVGLDASSEAVELAKKRFSHDISATIIECDMEAIDEVFGVWEAFDYISCLGAIEHTMNPKKAFQKMMHLLNPGGVLLILVPLEFEDCLGQLRNEPNQVTNERFASMGEWISYFGETPTHYETIGDGQSKDVALIYKKENKN